jgi:hypothetical protein
MELTAYSVRSSLASASGSSSGPAYGKRYALEVSIPLGFRVHVTRGYGEFIALRVVKLAKYLQGEKLEFGLSKQVC